MFGEVKSRLEKYQKEKIERIQAEIYKQTGRVITNEQNVEDLKREYCLYVNMEETVDLVKGEATAEIEVVTDKPINHNGTWVINTRQGEKKFVLAGGKWVTAKEFERMTRPDEKVITREYWRYKALEEIRRHLGEHIEEEDVGELRKDYCIYTELVDIVPNQAVLHPYTHKIKTTISKAEDNEVWEITNGLGEKVGFKKIDGEWKTTGSEDDLVEEAIKRRQRRASELGWDVVRGMAEKLNDKEKTREQWKAMKDFNGEG